MVCISVIVPVYNCEDYLEESLGSILNQTFEDIEIICIDDGSTDDSLRILRKRGNPDKNKQYLDNSINSYLNTAKKDSWEIKGS
jgi:glycosyltransferase involved in cell wall biosynthesis